MSWSSTSDELDMDASLTFFSVASESCSVINMIFPPAGQWDI